MLEVGGSVASCGVLAGNLELEVILKVEGVPLGRLAKDGEAREVLGAGPIRQVPGQERLGVAAVSLQGELLRGLRFGRHGLLDHVGYGAEPKEHSRGAARSAVCCAGTGSADILQPHCALYKR